jgi:hypothetical protein
MSATQDTGAGAPPEDARAEPPPVPDEDGPHDVPDDKVIEATLPASGSTAADNDREPR